MIKFHGYKGEYGFLSNFYLCPIQLFNLVFRSSEHVYQAFKAPNEKWFVKIGTNYSPFVAKKKANKVMTRNDWKEVRFKVMLFALQQKFGQHEDLRKRLLETGDEVLIEDSPTDKFWGGRDSGLNCLGKALMEIRNEFITGKFSKIDPCLLLAFKPSFDCYSL